MLSPGGRFSKVPVTLTGPKPCFEIKVSRKVGSVLSSNEVYFVSLADNFTVQMSKLLKIVSLMERGPFLKAPGNYRAR